MIHAIVDVTGRRKARDRRPLYGHPRAPRPINSTNERGARWEPQQQLVTRVDFVGVPSTDLERTVAFYEGTLGLRRSALVLERGFAEFETDNLTLSAYVPTMMGREHRPNPNPIALHVADMDAARARAAGGGRHVQR